MAPTASPPPPSVPSWASSIERPLVLLDRAALRVLDADTLRALQVVPYEVTDHTLRVAAATTTPNLLARRLRILTGLAIEITPASPDEIAAALAAGLAPETAASLIRQQTETWRETLHLTATTDAGRLEALSLATGRPLLDLARWRHDPALAPLFDARFARTYHAAPLLLLGRTLVVVTARGVWHEVAETAIAGTGFHVQVALATPGAVARLVNMLYGGHALHPGDAAKVDDTRRRGPVSLRGVTPSPQTAALLPQRFAERFCCLVVQADNDTLRVAITPDAPPELPGLLAAVLGRTVRLMVAPEGEIRAAIRRAYRAGATRALPGPRLPPLGVYLRRSGQVTAAQLAEALAEQTTTKERLGRILVRQGVISEEALLEALALRHDLPHLRLRGILPDPATVRIVPEELASQRGVLAVCRQEPVLHLAIADPTDTATLSLVEQVTSMRVRPVLAAAEEMQAMAGLLYHAGDQRPDAAVERFLDWLVDTGRIDRARALELRIACCAPGGRVDAILTEAGVADAEGVARLLADFTGLPYLRLWPAEQLVTETDEDGQPALHRRVVDPVDPAVARRLPPMLLDDAGAVPVAITDERVVVAIADPFDQEVTTQLQIAISRDYQPVISTREEIRAAIRRAVGQRTLGDHLLAAGLISPEELTRGLELARRSNVRLGKALLSLGYITEDQLVRCLAEQFEMPRVDLTPETVNEEVARLIPADLAQERGVLPLAVDESAALVATTDPLDRTTIEEVAQRLGRAVRTVLTTEQQMEAALGSLYRTEIVEQAVLGLLSRAPEDSAARVWTRPQVACIAGLGVALVAGLVLAPIPTLTVLMAGATAFYAAFSAYKLFLIYRALGGTFEEDVTSEELAALDERDLPVYTVLVPMYREASVLPILIQALGRLDYPPTKLDVILLLEEDDEETQAAVRATRLPAGFRALVVPFRRPKTKPKACNYGLYHARGEFLVIYDAEDVPEPDQLKKAVAIFRRSDERLACIQSKLNYFNRDQNLLTRWFTAEYSQWFDLLLPGLQNSGAPIPLGGTSNHFRTAILRELDGWDPFNTTEDADLGLRIFKRGYRTVVMNSTTYEEANSRLRNWVRQRSRWVKGYMQTWLVHMRHPLRLIRQIGMRPFLSFQLIIGGTFFSFLLNPLLWAVTALWFLTHWRVIQQVFPGPVFYVGTISLYAGNLAFLYINVLGTLRRQYYPLVIYALFTPLYWALMSVAAWLAFYELLFKPHYWQKTQHGLFTGRVRMPRIRKQAA